MKNCPKEEWFMKYAIRYHILKQNLNGYISNQEAAQTLNISLRHFKRLKAKFKCSTPQYIGRHSALLLLFIKSF